MADQQYPIERVRSFGMFGRFLTVDWGSHIEVGRFREEDDGRHWIDRPIEVYKPRDRQMFPGLSETTFSRLSLRSNAAETAEELAEYIGLLHAVQAVMTDLDDEVRFGS